jgi:TatD DNase family protein
MTLDLMDTHCHLDSEPFEGDRDACVQRAVAAGVTRMITIGTGGGLAGARRAIEIAHNYPMVWASVGVHPHNAGEPFSANELERFALEPKVVAIGETGLDTFRDWAPIEKQRASFELQIELARAVKKPLIIHSRETGAECLETLIRTGAGEVGGVFHCFSEDAEFAARLRDINFRISLPGQLTFKRNHPLRDICREIPIEQILVETDAPYLSPEPYRGKRCEPAFVVETARKLAEVKGLSLEEVAAITTRNALELFSLIR